MRPWLPRPSCQTPITPWIPPLPSRSATPPAPAPTEPLPSPSRQPAVPRRQPYSHSHDVPGEPRNDNLILDLNTSVFFQVSCHAHTAEATSPFDSRIIDCSRPRAAGGPRTNGAVGPNLHQPRNERPGVR